MRRRIPNSFEAKELQCDTQALGGTSCLSAARAGEGEAALVEPSEMIAPEMGTPSDIGRIAAFASTRLFESVDYGEEDSSEGHSGEYDVTAIGLSSAGGTTSTVDGRKPDVQQMSGAARVCERNNGGAHALSRSSPTDGVPHDDAGGCSSAQSSPYPCGAHACAVSLTEDIPAAFDGLSMQETEACQFAKKANFSRVGSGSCPLSDTKKGQGTEQQLGGTMESSHSPSSAIFGQGGKDGGGERSSATGHAGSQPQRGLGNLSMAKHSLPSFGRCGVVGAETSTVSQSTASTLGPIASLHGKPCATSQMAAVGSFALEKGVKGEWNPRTAQSRAGGVPSPEESAEVDPLQPQRLENGAAADRSAKTIVEKSKSDPGSSALASTRRRLEQAHSMNHPASSGDARSALVPKAVILAPIASHTAAGRPRLSSTDTPVGRENDAPFESHGDDQQQDAARPRSDEGSGTSFKLDDGNGVLPVENHAKAIHAPQKGNRSASSTTHDELQRLSRTREGSSDPESEGSHSVGAGVEDPMSSDDEHYNPSIKTDRFGFFVTSERREMGAPSKNAKARRLKEQRRTKKWRLMVDNFDEWRNGRKASRLRSRVRKGVPDCFRGKVWQMMTGSMAMMDREPHTYADLVASDVPVEGPIEEDIPRTMYDHELFCRKSRVNGREMLRRVLTAYGRYDREVQYCQGINYICALFLLYMPEENAFWLLVASMQRPCAPLRELFLPGMMKAQEFQFVVDSLTEKHCHKLSAQILANNLTPAMYATQWFLTAFTQRFPYELVTRVWDMFLLEDWKVFYRVCLALFKSVEEEAANLDLESLNLLLRNMPPKSNAQKILGIAASIPLKHRHIEKRIALFYGGRIGE